MKHVAVKECYMRSTIYWLAATEKKKDSLRVYYAG